MKLSIVSLAVLACAGCFNATISDDATVTKQVSFPPVPIPPGVLPNFVGTVDATTSIDVSSAFKDVAKFGTLTLSLNSDNFTGDLTWLTHLKMTLASADGKMPEVTFIDQDVPMGSTSVNVTSLLDNPTLQSYLVEGPMNVRVWVTGNAMSAPANGATLNWTMGVHADVSGSKSVGDLGSLGNNNGK